MAPLVGKRRLPQRQRVWCRSGVGGRRRGADHRRSCHWGCRGHMRGWRLQRVLVLLCKCTGEVAWRNWVLVLGIVQPLVALAVS